MRQRDDDISLSLDSFLDIITNVIGVMILLTVLAVITSQGISVSLGTPILYEPAPELQRRLFECRGNQIFILDERQLNLAAQMAAEDYQRDRGAAPSANDLAAWCEAKQVGNALYRVKIEAIAAVAAENGPLTWEDTSDIVFEPRAEATGESLREESEQPSQFEQHVWSLDRQKHFAYFIVREDSFEVFRAAREIVRAQGLENGWEPRALAQPLAFSKDGKIVKPQR